MKKQKELSSAFEEKKEQELSPAFEEKKESNNYRLLLTKEKEHDLSSAFFKIFFLPLEQTFKG